MLSRAKHLGRGPRPCGERDASACGLSMTQLMHAAVFGWRVDRAERGYPSATRGRYCNASAICAEDTRASPARSAIVRASFMTR